MPKPLKAKKRRQAVPTIRGYVYQIWHSLYAWVKLTEDDILYLEGAEDFDRLSAEKATAAQVKHTSEGISLGSSEVRKAIDDFLWIQDKNPDRIVYYRYLTTATAVVEKGSPFGKKQSGIELWGRCQQTGEGREAIRDFLLQLDGISERVLHFLTERSADKLLDGLIRPLSWEVETAQQVDIERWILDHLVNRGESQGISPKESEKAVNRLLRETLRAATGDSESQRLLTRAGFYSLFDEETSVRVPRSEVQFIPTHAAEPRPEEVLTTWTRKTIPPSLELVADRQPVLDLLRTCLQENGALVLTGSAGMGKTTLSKELVSASNDALLWIPLSSIPVEGRSHVAKKLSLLIPSTHMPGSIVVLDDLQHDWFSGASHDALATLWLTLRDSKVQIIATTRKRPPRRFSRIVGLGKDNVQAAPPLSQAEIKHFAIRMGCPSHRAQEWSDLIRFKSRGHPQLVHAYLLFLSEGHWPSLSSSSNMIFNDPREIRQEQVDIRDSLTSGLSSDRVRYLNFLSMIDGVFRRQHALMIGERLACIEAPGVSFDTLVGPWIEELHECRFQVSPLLDRMYDTAFSKDSIRGCRWKLAEIFLQTDTITPGEVSTALMQSLAGRNANMLMLACLTTLQNWTDETKIITAAHLSWISQVNLKNGVPSWCPPNAHAFFRALQFQVASLEKPEYSDRILELWDIESALVDDYDKRTLHRLLLCHFATVNPQCKASLRLVLPHLLEMRNLKRNVDASTVSGMAITSMQPPPRLRTMEEQYPGATYLSIVYHRVQSMGDLSEFVDFLDHLSKEDRNELLAPIIDGVMHPSFISAPWLDEGKKEEPKWDLVKEQLRQVMQRAESWEIDSIHQHAAGVLAAVDEHLGDFAAAHRTLDTLEEAYGQTRVPLERRATLLFMEKRYAEALVVWRDLFHIQTSPRPIPFPEEVQVQFLLSRREAAIAASELGQWSEASEFFLSACQWSDVMLDQSYHAALKADAALCAYRSGDWKQTVDLLDEVLVKLEGMDDADENAKVQITRRLVAHLILWIHTELRRAPEGEITEVPVPMVGFCSEPERSDDIKELPLMIADLQYAYLCAIEEGLLQQSVIFNRVSERLYDSRYAWVRFMIRRLDLNRMFRQCQFEQLIEKVAYMASEVAGPMHRFRERSKQGAAHNNLPDILMEVDSKRVAHMIELDIGFLIVAIIAIRIQRPANEDDLFSKWREALGNVAIWPDLPSMLALAEDSRTWSPSRSIPILTNTEQEPNRRLLAAVAIGTGLDSHVEAQFYAHSLLFSSLSQGLWRENVAEYLAELFKRQWLRFAATPALLRMPRLSVPGIIAACESSAIGLKKAARILLAAHLAVSSRIPNEAVESLKKIAEETV